jgi:DNA-binding MarR family transcriptional regulator
MKALYPADWLLIIALCNTSSVQSSKASGQTPSPSDQVADAVLLASRALVALAVRSIADEVTLAQFRALVVLQSRGPQRSGALADELQVVPSTATRMCDRLVEKGLISRAPRAGNRREVQLEITEAGSAIVGAVSRRRQAEIRRIVGRMDPSLHTALVTAMEEFGRAAGEVPEQQWFLGWA